MRGIEKKVEVNRKNIVSLRSYDRFQSLALCPAPREIITQSLVQSRAGVDSDALDALAVAFELGCRRGAKRDKLDR